MISIFRVQTAMTHVTRGVSKRSVKMLLLPIELLAWTNQGEWIQLNWFATRRNRNCIVFPDGRTNAELFSVYRLSRFVCASSGVPKFHLLLPIFFLIHSFLLLLAQMNLIGCYIMFPTYDWFPFWVGAIETIKQIFIRMGYIKVLTIWVNRQKLKQ